MKISIFLFLLTFMQVLAIDSYSQKTKLSLDMKNVTVEDILNQIENQSEFFFLFSPKIVDVTRKVNIKLEGNKIDDALNQLFNGTEIAYLVIDRQIVLSTHEQMVPFITAIQQEITITGKVTDEDGNSLPGVNIIIKGTITGTITNVDGNYTVKVDDPETVLVFTFIGMLSQEIKVGDQTVINITLAQDVIGLEEVVAIGYGTQKKINITGAITSVSIDELARRQVAQTSLALQGIAPGVVVTQRSGQPGRDAGTVSIRGLTTLGNNNPLILVDGISMSLNEIDPSMIESISILKDASSASIYGARAANGVILVTTKRAQRETLSVSYNAYGGYQQPTNIPNVVGAIDHMLMTNEAYTNIGATQLYSDAYIEEYRTGMATNPDRYPDTDWYDLTLVGSGLMQSHFLNVAGGTDRIRMAGTVGYLKQDGIMKNSDFSRYTVRLNSDMDLIDNFTVQFDIHIKGSVLNEPSRGTATAIHWSGRIPSNQLAVLSDGRWGVGWNGDNPVAFTQDGGLNTLQQPSVTLNLGLKYKPFKWVQMDLFYSPNYWQTNSSQFVKSMQTYLWDGMPSYRAPEKSYLNAYHQRRFSNNLRGTVTFNRALGNHNLTFLTGFQLEDYRADNLQGYRETFAFPDYPVLNSGGEENQKSYGSAEEWALLGYFGRFNYNYDERYLFEANLRYDGSSRFTKDNKWGLFPSFSAGWRISEEAFWAPFKDVVNYLKLRASWGQLGNQNIGTYPFSSDVNLGLRYIFDKQVVSGSGITSLANTFISWETTTVSNIGLDVTFLDRINVVAEYYYKITDDILLSLDIPRIIGMSAPSQNAGKVENRGWDLGINYVDREKEFKYDIGFNMSDVKNKILDLKGVERVGITVNHEGYPINSIYGLEADGLISADDYDESGNYLHAHQAGIIGPGDIKYVDQNNDGVIDGNDRKVIGSTIPRFTYGFTFNSTYRGFDFSFFLQGVGKADGLLRGQGIMPFVMGGTVQEQHKARWTVDNPDPNAPFPRFAFNEMNNEETSSFWMKNAAYLRLKNIQLGYSLPENITGRAGVRQLRFYVSAQNLFTIDDFWGGYDVEAPVGNGGYYPQVKTFILGLDVKF